MVVIKDMRLVHRPTNQSCNKCQEAEVVCFEDPSTVCQPCHVCKVACSVAGGHSGPRRKRMVTAAMALPCSKYFLSRFLSSSD